MDTERIINLAYFLGLDTVSDPLRLAPRVIQTNAGYKSAYPLLAAENVDIDDSYGLSSRKGYDLKLSGTDCHSLWSDGLVCLYVDGTTLYSLNKSLASSTSLLSGLEYGARMHYAKLNDRIYMTNGTYIGYYHDGAVYDLDVPTTRYKAALPAGKFITVLVNRILVASNQTLYIADPLTDCYDVRSGFRRFATNLTMLRALESGVYAADSRTYFIKDTETFERLEVMGCGVVPYTDVEIAGKDLRDGLDGRWAMWVSERGICLGSPTGEVRDLTADRYDLNYSYGFGGAFLRYVDGVNHYIATME